MKIAVYTVAKNEAQQVKPFMDSCREADQVVIADTGSTDDTPELLRQEGAIVHGITVKPWRFDHARTTSLHLIPEDIDVCIKLDLDERLQPGWRPEVERAWRPNTTRLTYWYTWNWTAPGVPDIQCRHNLIHARLGYSWRHPIHEILVTSGPELFTECDLAIHQFPEAKPRPDELSLLELGVREDRCPRTLFLLSRAYADQRRWSDAIRTLQEYLLLPNPHAAERAHAMRIIGDSFQRLGDPGQALPWLLRSCAEDPVQRENWIHLAEFCYETRDWPGGFYACQKALAIRRRHTHYESHGYAWGERPHELASICAYHLGLKDQAAEHLRQALAINPDHPRMKENLGRGQP